ncbi:MAG: HAD-IA family hydrolase [Clostridiaceae bacterium]|nr:HAD-IA family hydrolase [Clostridiaceae bacterium]
MIQAIFFDLFYTLIVPEYNQLRNENDVLGLSVDEWQHYAEDYPLYRERASGILLDENEIIRKITALMPMKVSDDQNEEILKLRAMRMKSALLDVKPVILRTIRQLKEKGLKIGLISNADAIDRRYWAESPLCSLFDDAVFSCDVGFLKPDKEIYQIALNRLDADAGESLFVGDGGSDELLGASRIGMKTVLAEVLTKYGGERRKQLIQTADHSIQSFDELLRIVSDSSSFFAENT